METLFKNSTVLRYRPVLQKMAFLLAILTVSNGLFAKADVLLERLKPIMYRIDLSKEEVSILEDISACTNCKSEYRALALLQLNYISNIEESPSLANVQAVARLSERATFILDVAKMMDLDWPEIASIEAGKKLQAQLPSLFEQDDEIAEILELYFNHFLGYGYFYHNQRKDYLETLLKQKDLLQKLDRPYFNELYNIGLVYYSVQHYDEANKAFDESIANCEKIATESSNILKGNMLHYKGIIAKEQGDSTEWVEKLMEAVGIYQALGADDEMVPPVDDLVAYYLDQDEREIALQWIDLLGKIDLSSATDYAKKTKVLTDARLAIADEKYEEASAILEYFDTFSVDGLEIYVYPFRKSVFQKLGNYKRAFEFSELEKQFSEKSEDMADSRALEKTNLEHQFALEAAKNELALNNEKSQALMLGVIAAVLFLGMIIILIQLRGRKRTNNLLQTQKEQIEKQGVKLISSIKSAERIQRAMLKGPDYMKNQLADAMVYFRPKDHVSGDFYWMEERNGYVAIAVADCTGHGVPGAFMSLIGYNALNRAFLDQKLTSPHRILEALRHEISEATSSNKSNYKAIDGMDLGICVYEKRTGKMHFAGAQMNLYLISHTGMVRKFEGDKIFIGNSLGRNDKTEFTNHNISFQSTDTFFMNSDGFEDQFGGQKNQKFNRSPFLQLLQDITKDGLSSGTELLDTALQDWKKEKPQNDDILVVGFQMAS